MSWCRDAFAYGDVVVTFILEVNPIANATFSKVEATADSNMELQ